MKHMKIQTHKVRHNCINILSYFSYNLCVSFFEPRLRTKVQQTNHEFKSTPFSCNLESVKHLNFVKILAKLRFFFGSDIDPAGKLLRSLNHILLHALFWSVRGISLQCFVQLFPMFSTKMGNTTVPLHVLLQSITLHFVSHADGRSNTSAF